MFRAACPMPQVRWPDGHTLFAQVDTTGQGKERNGSSVTLGGEPPQPYSPRLYGLRASMLRSRVGTAILRCRAGQLNESRLELLGFTIPPAWPCHAVPPLHKGGFFFARVNTTGQSKERNGSSVTLAPPGARKRSGKNLVFPRDPAAAPADYLQVISALCRNNTPPKLQKIPRRKPPGDFFAAASAAADALDHQISGLASAGRALG